MEKLDVIAACEGCMTIYNGRTPGGRCPGCGGKMTMVVSGSYAARSLFLMDALEYLRGRMSPQMNKIFDSLQKTSEDRFRNKNYGLVICSNN